MTKYSGITKSLISLTEIRIILFFCICRSEIDCDLNNYVIYLDFQGFPALVPDPIPCTRVREGVPVAIPNNNQSKKRMAARAT